jgi:hypothetical protein
VEKRKRNLLAGEDVGVSHVCELGASHLFSISALRKSFMKKNKCPSWKIWNFRLHTATHFRSPCKCHCVFSSRGKHSNQEMVKLITSLSSAAETEQWLISDRLEMQDFLRSRYFPARNFQFSGGKDLFSLHDDLS